MQSKNKIKSISIITIAIIIAIFIVSTSKDGNILAPRLAYAASTVSSFSAPTPVTLGKEIPLQVTPTTSSPVCTNYKVYEVPVNGIVPTTASPIYSSSCISGTSYNIPTTVVLKVNTIYGVTAGFCLVTNTKCASVFSVNPVVYFKTYPNIPILVATTKTGDVMRYDQIQNKWIVVTNIGTPTSATASNTITPSVAAQKTSVAQASVNIASNIITSVVTASRNAVSAVVNTVSNIITSISDTVSSLLGRPRPGNFPPSR